MSNNKNEENQLVQNTAINDSKEPTSKQKSTAERNRAVRNAWKRERQLVLEGKGTRDWTPEQQHELIEKGIVHDEDGKAFEGHHMSSVKAHPEYAGCADNIQFLSRPEHEAAHGGDFHNPTNGYYNPITKVTTEFPEYEYTPCEVIKLSNSVYIDVPKTSVISVEEKKSSPVIAEPGEIQKAVANAVPASTQLPKANNGIFAKASDIISKIDDLQKAHPLAAGLIKSVFRVGGGILAYRVLNQAFNGSGSKESGSGSVSSTVKSSTPATPAAVDKAPPALEKIESPVTRDYPEKRKSPVQHNVTGGRQRYGKDKHWVDKADYSRGGKKDDEE